MPPSLTTTSTSTIITSTTKQQQSKDTNATTTTTMSFSEKSQPQSLPTFRRRSHKVSSSINVMDLEVPRVIVWRNIGLFIYLHAAAVIGLYFLLTGSVMWKTMIWTTLFYFISGLGITAGCHRLWAHKSYKAKLPLRLLLTFFQTVAFQNSIYEWSRDHRVHHKYSETNADPHNAKRGFWFAHMGWLCVKKHPAVKEKGQGIDMSDLQDDPVLMFQKKYYIPMVLLCCFAIPTLVPMFVWGETLGASWFFATNFRFCIILHWTWLVNSAAHMWGNRPYDKTINPSQNRAVALLAMGEGWHNYHHTFPWDYKTAELGDYRLNLTTLFIDTMAKIGWAYDLKTVPENIVAQRVQRTGDGSHESQHGHGHHEHGSGPWGWGDSDIPQEDKDVTMIINQNTNLSSTNSSETQSTHTD